VHIDTGNGIQIVPNATLATGSFTNLSRVTGAAFNATAVLTFGAGDPPGVVTVALQSVADRAYLDTQLHSITASLGLGEKAFATTAGNRRWAVQVSATTSAERR